MLLHRCQHVKHFQFVKFLCHRIIFAKCKISALCIRGTHEIFQSNLCFTTWMCFYVAIILSHVDLRPKGAWPSRYTCAFDPLDQVES